MNIGGMLSKMMTKRTMLIMGIAVLCGVVAYFVYKNYFLPQAKPSYIENNEYEQKDEVGIATIYLFYTTWCPHCKKAKPEWEKFKNEYNERIINGKTLQFEEVDCDKDEETASRFNVEGYPTVKLVIGEQIIEFDAKPTYDTLVQFVESSL